MVLSSNCVIRENTTAITQIKALPVVAWYWARVLHAVHVILCYWDLHCICVCCDDGVWVLETCQWLRTL